MSKYDELNDLSKAALKEVISWLDEQGRVGDDWTGWVKEDCLEFLVRKLNSDQVEDLVGSCGDTDPFWDSDELSRILGFLPKDAMLESCSKEELREALEELDEDGRVIVSWRSFSKDELQDYLRLKCSQQELAELLGFVNAKEKKRSPSRRESDSGRRGSATLSTSTIAQSASANSVERSAGVLAARDIGGSVERTLPATPPQASVLAGATNHFLGYRLVRRLTGGGMAEAWEAVDGVNQRVFLKRVHEGSRDAPALKREAAIYEKLSRTRIEHVMDVLRYEHHDGWIVLVTEFADGGDLEGYIRKTGGLTSDEVRTVAHALARAIGELHAHNVVHRDLKPGNILNAGQRWKIADFGIAKNLDRLMTDRTMREYRTPGFSSPEQEDGVEARTSMDVYALGKIIVYMLTGQTDTDHVKYPSWSGLVRRCTERSAEARPSATELVRALEAIRV